MDQLAQGQRGYALSKALVGCKFPQFETKLDSGQRILWTDLRRGSKEDFQESILVWCVSKHDKVSHNMNQIDRACLKLSQTPTVVSRVGIHLLDHTVLQIDVDAVLLDPAGNTPLKLYTTSRSTLSQLSVHDDADWQPMLRLSRREREVSEQVGTVLVLGRSGTGKTLCLCERMSRDKNMLMRVSTEWKGRPQLFVCRSKRLCEFVKGWVQKSSPTSEIQDVGADFMTLEKFIRHMEAVVPCDDQEDREACTFVNNHRVNYYRFRSELYPRILNRKKTALDPLVLWTQVRSFIKGSIEAVLLRRPLSLEEYLDQKDFSSDRCYLSARSL